MKKFLFPLLMLLTLAACEKDAAKLAYVLTNENVKVNNLSQDYLVQVDNGARTIYIEVDYLDQNFEKKHGKYTGWTAQIIQHEVDHTNGIVI